MPYSLHLFSWTTQPSTFLFLHSCTTLPYTACGQSSQRNSTFPPFSEPCRSQHSHQDSWSNKRSLSRARKRHHIPNRTAASHSHQTLGNTWRIHYNGSYLHWFSNRWSACSSSNPWSLGGFAWDTPRQFQSLCIPPKVWMICGNMWNPKIEKTNAGHAERLCVHTSTQSGAGLRSSQSDQEWVISIRAASPMHIEITNCQTYTMATSRLEWRQSVSLTYVELHLSQKLRKSQDLIVTICSESSQHWGTCYCRSQCRSLEGYKVTKTKKLLRIAKGWRYDQKDLQNKRLSQLEMRLVQGQV